MGFMSLFSGNCETSSAISFLLTKKIKVPLISGLKTAETFIFPISDAHVIGN